MQELKLSDIKIGKCYKLKHNSCVVGLCVWKDKEESHTNCSIQMEATKKSSKKGCYIWAYAKELEEATDAERQAYLDDQYRLDAEMEMKKSNSKNTYEQLSLF